jgi:DNA polymerase III gamma/tau subunit
MSTRLDLKYRPKRLDEIIGHEKTVTKLKGLIASKQYPSCLFFSGPPSAGKTTFAYVFAAEVLGQGKEDFNVQHHPSFTEKNGADERTIESARETIQLARRFPIDGKQRFIFIDEFQQILSNAHAVQAFLKSLEQPVPTTTWILATMEPEKFQVSTNGKAILSRSMQFKLEAPTKDDLKKQAVRIIKGERLSFFTKDLLAALIEDSYAHREVAKKIEGLIAYYKGLTDPPEKLDPADVEDVLSGVDINDEKTAIRFLVAIYAKKFGAAQKELLDVKEGFTFLNKLLYLSAFMMNDYLLNGVKHPKVWATTANLTLKKAVTTNTLPDDRKATLQFLARVHTTIIQYKAKAATFAIDEGLLLTSMAYELVYN